MVDEAIRKFEEFSSIKFLTQVRNNDLNKFAKSMKSDPDKSQDLRPRQTFKKGLPRHYMEPIKKFHQIREKEALFCKQ